MSMKDWESTGRNNWIKRHKGERRIKNSISVDINFGGEDIVDIEHFQEPSKDKRIVFKSKSQALKFARNYMRKH